MAAVHAPQHQFLAPRQPNSPIIHWVTAPKPHPVTAAAPLLCGGSEVPRAEDTFKKICALE